MGDLASIWFMMQSREHHGLGLHELGGRGELTIIKGKMNSEHYHNILQDNLSMAAMKFEKEAEEWVFQHDNDPKHTNKSIVKWFNDHAITILQGSPQSPDMNPIKCLWNEVDQRLQLRKDLPH